VVLVALELALMAPVVVVVPQQAVLVEDLEDPQLVAHLD
jgi:hypothetical protein